MSAAFFRSASSHAPKQPIFRRPLERSGKTVLADNSMFRSPLFQRGSASVSRWRSSLLDVTMRPSAKAHHARSGPHLSAMIADRLLAAASAVAAYGIRRSPGPGQQEGRGAASSHAGH